MTSSTNGTASETKVADISCEIGPMYRGAIQKAGDFEGADGAWIEFTFGDDPEGQHSISFSTGCLTNAILFQAVAHGLKQKIGDAGAISRNKETGRSATIADKRAAMNEVTDRLMSGQWNKAREGGTGAAGGLLLLALCELKPNKTREEVQTYIDTLTDAQQSALRAADPVKPIIDRIKAERAARKQPGNAADVAAELLARF